MVRFVYKDFPLVEIHPWAMHAAVTPTASLTRTTMPTGIHRLRRTATPTRSTAIATPEAVPRHADEQARVIGKKANVNDRS